MPFDVPTLNEIIDRSEADLAARLGVGPFLRRSFEAATARVLSGLSYHLHLHAEFIARQIIPVTAEGVYLTRHAETYGLARKPAVGASGTVDFAGADGSTIPTGTRLQRADGVQFDTTAEGVIAGGTATVAVQAVLPGASTDTAAATVLNLTQPVAGVNAAATVTSGDGLTGGTDSETDEDLRARLLQRIRNPLQGGAESDYVAWALEVPEVTRAWSLPQHDGDGSVGVTFVIDNDPAGPVPPQAKLDEVAAYIEPRRPATARVVVFAPGTKSIDPTVQLIGATSQSVQDAVTASLQDLVKRSTAPGETLPVSHIREAISNAPGEVDHVLTSPAADVTTQAGEILVLGTVTFS